MAVTDYGFIPPPDNSPQPSVIVDYHNPTTGDTYQTTSGGWTAPEGWVQGKQEGTLYIPNDFLPEREKAEEVKPIKTTTPKKEEESLKSFLEEQRVDPSIPTSGQQTYTKIQKSGKDKLYDIGKIISEDFNLSMEGANKLEELIINEGTFNNLDPSNIAGLKDLVAKTYEDNVKTISDVQRDEALTQAQTKDTLTQQVEEVKSEGLTKEAESAKRDTLAEEASLIEEVTPTTVDEIDKVEGVATQIEDAPQAIGSITREVDKITTPLKGEALVIAETEINNILDNTTSASYEATIGAIRQGNASEISNSIQVGNTVRDIFTGEAQIDSLDDIKVNEALAALPQEALISSQLEILLSALDNDEIPNWAKPSVEKVDALLAKRGMGRSSIAKEALFNAIITAATPLAQSNALALQQRAQQNLDNKQRAEELSVKLNADIRNANLSNKQTMAVENLRALNLAESEQFNFNAKQQLTEYETLINFKIKNADYAQQMEMANLSDEVQLELANLSHKNTADAANMSSDNQLRLTKLQDYVAFVNKNADFAQQMEITNLDMEGKVEFANLQALNDSNRDQMTVDQQSKLVEYQAKVDISKYNAELAQQMNVLNLSNAQQSAVQNAMNVLNMDMKELDINQQIKLANSKFLQTMTVTDLSNRQQGAMLNASNLAALDMTDLSNSQQAQVENAKHFLQLDIANLSNSQQAEILNDQWSQQVLLSNVAVENAAKQFASSTENDINKFISTLQSNIELNNKARDDSMEMFNATEKNKALAIEANNDQAIELYNTELYKSLMQFEEQVEFQRESFNASMEYQIDSSNVQWRRNMNTADTAGINAVNQANAINAFNLSSDAMSKLWQETRDNAQWEFLEGEQGKSRQTQLLIATLGNENDQLLKSMGIKADNATAVGTALWELTTSFFEGD